MQYHLKFFECNSRHKISIEIIDNYLDLEGKERTILNWIGNSLIRSVKKWNNNRCMRKCRIVLILCWHPKLYFITFASNGQFNVKWHFDKKNWLLFPVFWNIICQLSFLSNHCTRAKCLDPFVYNIPFYVSQHDERKNIEYHAKKF